MSATLSIVNNFSLPTQGNTYTGQQGPITALPSAPLAITVNGTIYEAVNTLATAAIVTIFDSDDVPATWQYLFYWADQITYIQIIGSGSNAIFKVAAMQPFVLPGYNKVLAAANTTPIAGGSEPAVTTVASVVLGNYSGTAANYLFAVIN